MSTVGIKLAAIVGGALIGAAVSRVYGRVRDSRHKAALWTAHETIIHAHIRAKVNAQVANDAVQSGDKLAAERATDAYGRYMAQISDAIALFTKYGYDTSEYQKLHDEVRDILLKGE